MLTQAPPVSKHRDLLAVQHPEGLAPHTKTANCKPNEVEIPNVVGDDYEEARARLTAQPLTPVVVYKPAAGGQQLNVVVKQIPAKGRLSSFDKVTIVFAKPTHGVIPKVVGLPVAKAQSKLERLKLRAVIRGNGATIVRQNPRPGLAAAAGLPVTLWAARG